MTTGQKVAIAPAISKWVTYELIDTGIFGLQSIDSGATWTQITPTGMGTFQCNAIKWFGDLALFFYGHVDGTIYTSPDGIVWTSRQDIGGTVWGFAYSVTLDLLVAATGGLPYWSDDNGVTWTVGTGASIAIDDVIWDPSNAIFIGVESGTRDVYTSSDGKAWTRNVSALPVGTLGNTHSLAVNSTGRTVVRNVIGTNSAYSDNGTSWTLATTTVNLKWNNVVWDSANSQFVMCENGGANSSFATSPDGDVWTERTQTYTGTGGWQSITFGSIAVSSVDSMANTARLAVTPGQQIAGQAFAKITGAYSARVGVGWYNAGGTLLSISWTDSPITLTGAYRRVSATGIAPDLAATCTVVL
ncbi:hypothetical protein LCGC14_2680180, partial [marine sediment metagenome]